MSSEILYLKSHGNNFDNEFSDRQFKLSKITVKKKKGFQEFLGNLWLVYGRP